MTDEELRQLIASNAQAIAAMREQHAADHQQILAELRETRTAIAETRASIAETKEITESNAKAIAANSSAIAETRKIADSNARSIEAWAETIQDDRADREEEDSRIRIDLRTTHDMISGLIQERRTDWAEWRRQQEERDQRFTNLLEDAREDRKANEREHDAFRENIQVLLAEIARVWQRLQAS